MLKSGEMSAECGEITLRVMGSDEGSLCYLHPFNGFESLKGNGRGEVMNYDRSILALSPEDVERPSEGALVAVGCRACVMVFFCVCSLCLQLFYKSLLSFGKQNENSRGEKSPA